MSAHLKVENLGLALAELGAHAADMQLSGVDHHDSSCLWCQTSILLARVVRFGGQLRDIELQELNR